MQLEKSIAYQQAVNHLEYHLLAPDLTEQQTILGCELAKSLKIQAVCVKPCFVLQAVSSLRGTQTIPSTVISYPFGVDVTSVKVSGLKRALVEGALEINFVANLADLLGGKDQSFSAEIDTICGLAHMNGAKVNVILNCDYLSNEQIVKATQYVIEAGADWISPSPGFEETNSDGHYLPLIIETAERKIKLKTMGRVQNFQVFEEFFGLGCERIGTRYLQSIISVFNND